MTEDVFGMLKQRWPRLRNLRCHYDNAKATILAAFVLHNFAVRKKDDLPEVGFELRKCFIMLNQIVLLV
jgi:hypothetical protein